MARAVPTKNTGDQLTAAELNALVDDVETNKLPALNTLTDVTITTPVSGHALVRDSVDFKNRLLVKTDISDFAHNHTKSEVGLGNVDNTADSAKPISDLTQTALDGKAATGHTHLKANITDFSDSDYATAAQGTLADSAIQPTDSIGTLTDVTITTPASGHAIVHNGVSFVNRALSKSDVGLSNVDDTADTAKPISTATQTALNGKVDVDSENEVKSGSFGADTFKTAFGVYRNNVRTGRLDNNGSGLRVQAETGDLQLRGSGNSGLTINSSGVASGTLGGYSEATVTSLTVNASANNFTTISTGTLSFSFVPASVAYTCTVVVTGNSVTWPSGVKWTGGTAPTLTANEDIIVLTTVDGGTSWYGSYSLGHV